MEIIDIITKDEKGKDITIKVEVIKREIEVDSVDGKKIKKIQYLNSFGFEVALLEMPL